MKIKIAATIILAIFICGSLSGQGKNNRKKVVLTGTIVNRDSVPVSDVMIFVDGMNTNRMTNAKGEFRLRIKPDIQKISFFRAEYGGFEVDYSGQEKLEVMINHESDNVAIAPSKSGKVVETGYGKIGEDDLVGTISSINDNKFKNRSYKDIYEMIVGELPGVTVEGTSIRIRGVTSINSSNEPLLIVDGSPVQSLSYIAPADVESINVLKGSSTAIYGSRGAAGVVVIKTKSGNRKK
jgi:TonB-dependent SusC/RagA subfamily outer membrane receptor